MTIKRTQIAPLVDALRDLNGSREKPFVFDPKTRYALSKNVVLLGRVAAEINAERVRIITDLSPEKKSVKPDTPEFEVFSEMYGKFLEGSHEFPNLIPIRFEDLNIDGELKGEDGKPIHPAGNAIPFDLVAQLDPLFVREDVVTG